MDIIVSKTWKITKKLGSGAFGEIFHAINTKTNEEVAIKLEPKKTEHPQLMFEAKLYQFLHQDSSASEKGIPRIYHQATEGDYNVLVMELLGLSLEDAFDNCGRKLSIGTVVLLAEQLISRIEYFHSRNFLHRDIKPDNFLIGHKNQTKLYLIDYGLAKRYINKNGQHIPYKDDKDLTGTARYASANTHLGIEQSRRDDLESLGYVMMYFLRGILPWQNLKAVNKKEKYQKIMEKKIGTPVEELCKGFPVEFQQYLLYCKSMKFEQKPDYAYLKSIFKNLASRMKDMNIEYDWIKFNQKNEKPKNYKVETFDKLIQKEIQEKLKEKDNKPLQINSTQIAQKTRNGTQKDTVLEIGITGKQTAQKQMMNKTQTQIKRNPSTQKFKGGQQDKNSEQFKLIQVQQQNKYTGPKIAVSKATYMK